MNVNELHKPRIRRQTQPVADALPWGYAANFKRSVRLPLYHGDITALGILPDGARGSRGLGDNTIYDAGLGAQDGAIKYGRVEIGKFECDTVRLHGSWHR